MQSFEHMDLPFKSLNTYSVPVAPHSFETIMMKRAKRKKPFLFWLDEHKYHLGAALFLLSISFFTFVKMNTNSTIKNTDTVALSPLFSTSTPPSNNQNSNTKNIVIATTTGTAPSKEIKKSINNGTKVNVAPKKTNGNDHINNIVTSTIESSNAVTTSDISSTAVPQINEIESSTISNSNKELTTKEPIETPRKLLILDKLNLDNHLLEQKMTPHLLLGGKDKCPSFSSNSAKTWYVDAWISPDYAIRSIKERSNNSEYIALAASRNTNEKFQFAGSGGIKASLVMKSGLSLRLGFMYSHIWEYFDFKNPGETQRKVDTVVTVIINGPGDTTFRKDVRVVTLIGERIVKNNNYYKLYDIPLQVGYEFGRDKSQRYSVNLGMNINISAAYRGKTLDENGRPIDFSTGNDKKADYYQNSVGLSFYASVAMYKRINDNWQFVVEPNMRYMLGSLTKDTYELSHRYTTFGLNLGLRYKIN